MESTSFRIITPSFYTNTRIIKKYANDIRCATTNYDTVIERFCGKANLKCIDGFVYDEFKQGHIWSPSIFEKSNENILHNNLLFYKLHGSLTWRDHSEYGFVKEVWNEEKIVNTTGLKKFINSSNIISKRWI
jgi:hypothetical protein